MYFYNTENEIITLVLSVFLYNFLIQPEGIVEREKKQQQMK